MTGRLLAVLATMLASATLSGCGSEPTMPPPSDTDQMLVAAVRHLAAERGITALRSPPPVRTALVQLGQALAFDKILSGNHDVSCMTCHLPRFASSDGRSLPIGAGGTGLGPDRVHPQGVLIPRNAPALFNVESAGPMFLDGRVEKVAAGHLHTPAGPALTDAMASVFEFGAVSAQGMFPVLSPTEMRGASGNELATVPADHPAAIWQGLMARLGAIPAYRTMFEAAYPGTSFDEMTFAHASNAIAGFLVTAFDFHDSPWDRFLAGADGALSTVQLQGAKNFLTAKCSVCHNGPAFTDRKFHNVAVAQIGPGEADGDDIGRMAITGDPADKYRFKTTPLRNIELTAPYGHDGAYPDLRGFVDHYSESDLKLRNFDPELLEPALRHTLLHDADAILATRDTLLDGVVFDAKTIDQVTEFLKALTDPAARNLLHLIPDHVPSGLPVER